jgi:hypothetical protein
MKCREALTLLGTTDLVGALTRRRRNGPLSGISYSASDDRHGAQEKPGRGITFMMVRVKPPSTVISPPVI